MSERDEVVDHPPHYNIGGLEVIDAIEAWDLGFHAGNVIKYVARAGRKGGVLVDLKKAQWYLVRLIAREEAAAARASTVKEGSPASRRPSSRGPRT